MSSHVRMPFGKYKGETIDSIESSYIRFLLDQDWFNDKFTDLSNELVGVLKERGEWED